MFVKCKNCKDAALPDRKYCQKHLDYINQKARERVGKCKQCNEPVADGKSRCLKHQEEVRIKSAERKARLKANGLCRHCGEKALDSLTQCKVCNDKSIARNKAKVVQRRLENKCTCCGDDKENINAAYCNVCIDKDRKRLAASRKKLYENGFCVRCKKENPSKKYLCFECSFEYRIRISMICALKKQGVSRKIDFKEVIGCTPEFFRDHIKNLMEPWMNESNYGVHVPGERRWQLGHKIPRASFDLSDVDQLKKCWHYTNIIPQEAEENITFQDWMFNGDELVRGRHIKLNNL